MIKVLDIKKNYNDEVMIGPISIDIPESGITSIIGPNGAGKSTLLLMMGRIIPQDEGSVFIGDFNINQTSQEELAKTISTLRQENRFITRLTVRELVGFGRFPHSKGRLKSEDGEIINKYLEFFDLVELQDRYLDELSGGQRQRAYVAMVLTQETKYVFLDEPLNNLDISNSVRMLNHLRRASDELKRSIVMVMHDINFAARYSDLVLALKRGKVFAFGKNDEIINSNILTKLFDSEIEVMEGPKGPVVVY